MMKPVPMMKVAIVGTKGDLAATVDSLHEANVLHVEDYQPGEEGFDLGSPLPNSATISERLLRLRGVIKGARMEAPAGARPVTESNLFALEGRLREIEDELAFLVEARNKVNEELKRVDEDEALLARIRNFPLDVQHLAGYRSLATAAGIVDPRTDLSPLKSLGPHAELVESEEEGGRFVAVFAPKAQERALQDAVAKVGLQTLELPASPGVPAEQLQTLARRREELSARGAELDGKIATIRGRHAGAFLAWDEHLAIEADKATAPVRFRTTKNSFMIEGWVPREDYGRLQRALRTHLKDRVFVSELPASSPAAVATHAEGHEHEGVSHGEAAEDVPVKLKNWNASGPYELLTDTYARPKYRELDPTLFFFFGFPLFYGIMLGDIGYAAVLLLLVFTGVFSRVFRFFGFQSLWHLNRIILHSAIASLAFGVLYSEFFGLELFGHEGVLSHFETHLGPIPYPLARFANVKLLLLLSLVIAVLHLGAGLVLGLRNGTVAHGFGHALKHRGSWLFILLALVILGTAIIPPILGFGTVLATGPIVTWSALGAFLLGTLLLVLGEGPTAILELPTILSNLLSYTRLVAIGLSGAGIALAGNEVAKLAFEAGGATGLIFGILLLAVFHLINLALGIIGPAVHSLRLHYVEFFTKFYEGGGLPYAPFGTQRKYTVRR